MTEIVHVLCRSSNGRRRPSNSSVRVRRSRAVTKQVFRLANSGQAQILRSRDDTRWIIARHLYLRCTNGNALALGLAHASPLDSTRQAAQRTHTALDTVLQPTAAPHTPSLDTVHTTSALVLQPTAAEDTPSPGAPPVQRRPKLPTQLPPFPPPTAHAHVFVRPSLRPRKHLPH